MFAMPVQSSKHIIFCRKQLRTKHRPKSSLRPHLNIEEFEPNHYCYRQAVGCW